MCQAVFFISKVKTFISKVKGITWFGWKFCICLKKGYIKSEGDNFFIHRVLGTSFKALEGWLEGPILAWPEA
jgi:hypothetical protein